MRNLIKFSEIFTRTCGKKADFLAVKVPCKDTNDNHKKNVV